MLPMRRAHWSNPARHCRWGTRAVWAAIVLALAWGPAQDAQGKPKKKKDREDPPAQAPEPVPPPPTLPTAKPRVNPPEVQAEMPNQPGASRETVIVAINRLPPERRAKYLAIIDIADQGKLAKIALEDNDPDARGAAVNVMTDQRLLAKVAGESIHWTIRFAAIRRINGEDQESLIKLLRETKDGEVSGIGISKVKDPAVRAELQAARSGKPAPAKPSVEPAPAKPSAEPAKQPAKAAAPALSPELAAALESKNPSRRMDAVRELADPVRLFQIAMEDEDPRTAEAAAMRLRSGTVGTQGIAGNPWDRMALDAKSALARRAALGFVLDAKVVAKIVEDPSPLVREAIAWRVEKPADMAKLAVDPEASVRHVVAGRATDKALLKRMAESDPDPRIRSVAKSRLDRMEAARK